MKKLWLLVKVMFGFATTLLLSLIVIVNGCAMMSVPVVNQNGQIVGGHPKLRSLLQKMVNRAEEIESAQRESPLVFRAEVGASPNSVVYFGTIPSTRTHRAIQFFIVTSPDGIESANTAVFWSNHDRADQGLLVLVWKHGTWVPTDFQIFGVGQSSVQAPAPVAK